MRVTLWPNLGWKILVERWVAAAFELSSSFSAASSPSSGASPWCSSSPLLLSHCSLTITVALRQKGETLNFTLMENYAGGCPLGAYRSKISHPLLSSTPGLILINIKWFHREKMVRYCKEKMSLRLVWLLAKCQGKSFCCLLFLPLQSLPPVLASLPR